MTGGSSRATDRPEETGRGTGGMPGIYVAVGSNIDPENHIVAALEALSTQVHIIESSTFYRTAPVGAPGTPPFYNGVWQIDTTTGPRALKWDVLRGVEAALGRHRSDDRNAPRRIDLDLVLYGSSIIYESGLRLPDPDIYTRPFVAAPLAELCPDGILPDSGIRIGDLETTRSGKALEALTAFTSQVKGIIHERKTHR